MDGMVDPALKLNRRTLDGRRERLLYEFNLLPAAYADSSWIESVCVTNSLEYKPDHAGCIEHSSALLQHHGLCEKFDWSVRAASVRLALLQRTAFMRICTAIGLMSAAPEIRRTIDGKTLRSLDSTFGDLTEAAWAPESLILARAGAEHNLVKHAKQLRLEQARIAGYRVYKALLYAESKEAPESISRALFRLPMSVAAEPVTPIDAAVVKPVMRWICRSAVKRWEPSWAWLF